VGCFERKDANGNWSDPCRFGDEERSLPGGPSLPATSRRGLISTANGDAEPESVDVTDAKAPRRGGDR